MGSEVVAALLGALVGGIIAVVGNLAEFFLSGRREEQRRVASARLDLVRSLWRNKLNYSELVLHLNDVPPLFGDDPKAMELWRNTLDSEVHAKEEHILALLRYLSESVGMGEGKALMDSDVMRGFRTVPEAELSAYQDSDEYRSSRSYVTPESEPRQDQDGV